MDANRILGVLGAGFGAAFVVLGLWLKWWIPEEADGWYPMALGAAILLVAVVLLRRAPAGAHRPQ